MALSCILLSITGFAFLFHLEQVGAVFGGFPAMKNVHNWAGVVFSVSVVLSMFCYLKEALTFDADDLKWIAVAGGYLSKKVKVPPMGKMNTGQKFAYLAILLAGIAISVSGYVIWLMPDNKQYVLLSHLVHNISFVVFMSVIPIHIYLGSIGNPGTFRIMVTGTIPYYWAKKKHPKWIAEVESHSHKA
jgi:formate dehydrogenase subunit gamma